MDDVQSPWSSVEEHHHRQKKREDYGQHHNQASQRPAIAININARLLNDFSRNASNGDNARDSPNTLSDHRIGKYYPPLENDSNRIAPQSIEEDIRPKSSSELNNGHQTNLNHTQDAESQHKEETPPALASLETVQNKTQLKLAELISETLPKLHAMEARKANQLENHKLHCNNNGVHHISIPTTPILHADFMKLTRELEQERNKSADLERRVKDLSEMCEIMEEEADFINEELARVSDQAKKSVGTSHSVVSIDAHINDQTQIEEHRTSECLEQALKLQVEKRMESEAELVSLRKKSVKIKHVNAHSSIANFFKDVKNLVSQLKISSVEGRTNNNPVQEQLNDFDELLTAFLQETDGLDGDEEEKSMDRKDVIWFLNELKLRFIPIRESCEKDNQSMITFASQLGMLTEKAITDESNTEQIEPPTAQLKARELEIAKLEGEIVQLKENVSPLHQQVEKNATFSKNKTTQDLQIECNTLRKKHKHLESRHSSLAREMQDSIRSKDKKIVSLKNALKENGAVNQLHATPLPNSIKSNMTAMDIESYQKEIDERNSLIDEMRAEIERLTVQMESTVADEADKIRLRYLEGIVHELKRKLAVVTASSHSSCDIGPTSLYDIEYPWSCMQERSYDCEEGVVLSDADEENLKDKVLNISDCLARSEHERVIMEKEFKMERDSYERKFSNIQHLLKYVKAPPEVLNSLQNI